MRDGVALCKVHLHVAPRHAAEAAGEACRGQDHALARDRRGPLAGAPLRACRARLRAHAGRHRPAAGAVGGHRRQRPSAPRARGGPPSAGRARACRDRLPASAPRGRRLPVASCAVPLPSRAPSPSPRRATTRNSNGCRGAWRCCRGASALRDTPWWRRSRAWTPPARAARSGGSRRHWMRGSTAWCRCRRRHRTNSPIRTSGASGGSCRRAATTRSSIAAGTAACWSSVSVALRRPTTGVAPMPRSTSSSGNCSSTG